MLAIRNIYTCNSSHVFKPSIDLKTSATLEASALTLLVPRVLANDSHNALSPDDFTVPAEFLYRCANFHNAISPLPRGVLNAARRYGHNLSGLLS
jgi:hypothetical protein